MATRNVTITETAGQKRVFQFEIELDSEGASAFLAAGVRKAFHAERCTGFHSDSGIPVTQWDGCTVYHGVAVRSYGVDSENVISTRLRVDVSDELVAPKRGRVLAKASKLDAVFQEFQVEETAEGIFYFNGNLGEWATLPEEWAESVTWE